MAGIHDIGNGFGYVYMTATDGTTIESVVSNTLEGVRCFRENGNVVAPLAASRSAFGVLTFTTGVAGAGSITGVSVNGVDQIGASLLVTGFTDAQCATVVANAINVFTPGSGYDYTAVAVGDSVYIFAPPSAGSTPNGYAILVSDTGAVVTYNADSFKNGSNDNGAYDSISGSRFFLNADYGPNGISGELTADPTNLVNAVEITKYFIMRGQQVGIFSKDVTASSNTLYGIDRSGMMTKVNITPAVGTTETVIKLSAEDFIEGDVVFLAAKDSAHTITVESAPAVTVPGTGNIYLTDDLPWISNRYTSLMLLFKYITGIGPCFVEMARSLATPDDTMIGATLYVSSEGDDTTAVRGNIKRHYATITAAKTAASSGDVIVVFPGTYNEGGLQKDGINYYFMPGAIVSYAGRIFEMVTENVVVEGSGEFISTGDRCISWVSVPNSGSLIFRGKSIKGTTGIYYSISNAALSPATLDVEIESNITGTDLAAVYISGYGNARIVAADLKLDNTPGAYSYTSPSCANLYMSEAYGKIYVKSEEMSQVTSGCSNVFVNLSGGVRLVGDIGYQTIECRRIFNRHTTGRVQSVVFYGAVRTKLIGDVVCIGSGNQSDGIFVYAISASTSINTFISHYGDIYTNDGKGVALMLHCGSGVNYGNFAYHFYGNIQGRTENIALDFVPVPAAPASVCLGGDAFTTGNVIMAFRHIRGSITQTLAGTNCIYKAMQSINSGASEQNIIMELNSIKLFQLDGVTETIYAEAPAGVPVNMAVVMGSYANVAANVNLTIEGALTVNANVSSDTIT